VRIVIDHMAGSRRGRRQELPAGARVRFGRHPDCEVAFDPVHDTDASSRHAELRPLAQGWTLVDLGSTNGTYVEGLRVTEAAIESDRAVLVAFGPAGPLIRLFVGDEDAIKRLPPPPIERSRLRWLIGIAAGVVVLTVVALARC
jgi:pSer/pThr/pTyr-binding forkhead associated (FHA) protein